MVKKLISFVEWFKSECDPITQGIAWVFAFIWFACRIYIYNPEVVSASVDLLNYGRFDLLGLVLLLGFVGMLYMFAVSLVGIILLKRLYKMLYAVI